MIKIPYTTYWIKPQIQAIYDDGKTYIINGNQCCASVKKELNWEPTLENAQKFLDEFVPLEFHHTVTAIWFRHEQPLNNIQPDIMYLNDKQELISWGFQFSFSHTLVRLRVTHSHKKELFIRPYSQRGHTKDMEQLIFTK